VTRCAQRSPSCHRSSGRAVVGPVLFADDYDGLSALTGTSQQVLRARDSRGLRALRLRLAGGRP
jgi:hypothetical protein